MNNNSDKTNILLWAKKHMAGFKNAKKKEEILNCLIFTLPNISERRLREILSDLKHDGEIGSLSSLGYWAIPAVCNDRDEIEMAKSSWFEMEGRALDMLTDCRKQLKQLDDRLLKITQGQQEFAVRG